MTIYYCDRSQFQGRAGLSGALVVCARASEGNWLADSSYQWNKAEAASVGAYLFAYHFLESSSSASQASWCHGIVGSVPLMLDFEPITGTPGPGGAIRRGRKPPLFRLRRKLRGLFGGSYPSVSLALAFIDEYRALGGTCHVVYLPRWYWQELGSPSLQGFIDRKCVLVSSEYTTYSDDGPGWLPYVWAGGEWWPSVWQYSDSVPFHGVSTDFNAYRGTGGGKTETVNELEWLVRTGKPHAPPPPPPPPRKTSPAVLMTGDEMFVLAFDGAGNAPLSIPQFLPDGTTLVSGVQISATGPAQMRFAWDGGKYEPPVTIDWGRGALTVPLPAAGARAGKVQRLDKGDTYIAATYV